MIHFSKGPKLILPLPADVSCSWALPSVGSGSVGTVVLCPSSLSSAPTLSSLAIHLGDSEDGYKQVIPQSAFAPGQLEQSREQTWIKFGS